MSEILKAVNLDKFYEGPAGARIHVLGGAGFSLVKNPGEEKIVFLTAPDGSGKSTLLRILAGIETRDGGTVYLEDKEYTSPGSGIAYIPEKPSSYLWMSVIENFRSAASAGADEKRILEITGLTGYEEHVPDSRSRGFRFRIALGRALMSQPKVLLLDEPLRGMDETVRTEIIDVIRSVRSELKILIVLGSGNLNDAALLADTVLFLSKKPGTIVKQSDLSGTIEEKLRLLLDEAGTLFGGGNIYPVKYQL